ncbi:MAG: TolC family protein [Sphingomonas adhaesiva]|uniref:TolC family protein n=1 Tax=Sphingomonas adhaesiva TaxID=28212 RepID=UPI002FF557FC
MIGAAILLAGCAARETERPAAAVPVPPSFATPALSASSSYVADDQWWTGFGDARLAAFVDQAVNRNPQVGQAIGELRQANAQARIARADGLPQVSAAFNAARQRFNLAGAAPVDDLEGGGIPLPSGFTFNTFQVSADVSWELDLWGRIGSQTAAARADYLASAENLRGVRQSIAAEATRLYFTVAEARAQVSLAEATVRSVGEVTRQLRDRAAVGVASPSDRALADANFASVNGNLAQRRETLARTTRELEVLLREYPGGTLETAAFLPDLPPPPAAGVPADLLARRPDVAAAELALRAAGFRLTAAQRSFLPGLSLSGNIGTVGNSLDRLFAPGSLIWSIAGSVLQPIFQGGRLRAQVIQAEGARKQALEAYAEVALRALSEVEIALSVDRHLVDRERFALEAAVAAETAARVAFDRYREGIDPFIAVQESQQQALDSRGAYLSARRARLDNRINLHLALGGGFEEAPDVTLAETPK